MDRVGEVGQVPEALDTTEAALRFCHSGGGPSESHVTVAPARLTLRWVVRTVSNMLSMQLVDERVRSSVPVIPRRVRVRVSSIPSLT